MPTTPRDLWRATEGLHAIVYFAPEVERSVAATGVEGWWRGYFAGRAAPMGAVGPEVVGATFGGFAPSRVASALPSAWAMASPAAVTSARLAGLAAAFERVDAPDGCVTSALTPVAALLDRAADGVTTLGRPLAAAWAAERVRLLGPDAAAVPSAVRAWLATAVLREHRGDAHVAALAAAGLDGCEPHVLVAAAGTVPAAVFLPGRGWSEAEWIAAAARLERRGLIDGSGRLTSAGAELRAEVEGATDRAGAASWSVLDPGEQASVVRSLGPLGAVLVDRVPIRVPNGMGWEPLA